jgi:hypothetical protein
MSAMKVRSSGTDIRTEVKATATIATATSIDRNRKRSCIAETSAFVGWAQPTKHPTGHEDGGRCPPYKTT